MGRRGPKPLPDNVHQLNGNPSKKRLNFDPNTQIPVEIPEPPEHLGKDAQAEWKRISGELYKIGLIAKVDRAALAAYCVAFGRWCEIETELKKRGLEGLVQSTPNGYEAPSALIILANRQVEIMHKFMAEFGMTPSARVRVNPSPQMSLFGDEKADNDKAKKGKSNSDYFSK